jgi:Collagen triple helix repeat (20 copies)
MSSIRRHLSYANVIATLALVFAMSGGALAATHYLIISTKQIKPSVLKKLKGNRGASGLRGSTGATGATGATGPQGTKGEQGPAGPFPSTLPTGQTLTGAYEADGADYSNTVTAIAGASISFQFPLAAAPATHFIAAGATPPAQCPGTVLHPKALSGNLCVYEGGFEEVKEVVIYEPASGTPGASAFGAGLVVTSNLKEGHFYSNGTWAVTG